MRTNKISFTSGELKLEGYCYYPDNEKPCPGVVLCHPHPLHGGSMSATVIRQIGMDLITHNIITMMFNFRGVGKSEGNFGGGIAEQDDVTAALNWLISQSQVDNNKIGVAGYSFGGTVATPVACRDSRIAAMALIAPAIDESYIKELKNCPKNKLFIIGENDELIPPEKIKAIYQASAEPKHLELIPGADHFWGGYEKILAEAVTRFFVKIWG